MEGGRNPHLPEKPADGRHQFSEPLEAVGRGAPDGG